jgi:hypothetical protein
VTPDERGHRPLIADRTVCGDQAALVARLADLVEVLTDAEVVELPSVPNAKTRAHGLAPSRKAAR